MSGFKLVQYTRPASRLVLCKWGGNKAFKSKYLFNFFYTPYLLFHFVLFSCGVLHLLHSTPFFSHSWFCVLTLIVQTRLLWYILQRASVQLCVLLFLFFILLLLKFWICVHNHSNYSKVDWLICTPVLNNFNSRIQVLNWKFRIISSLLGIWNGSLHICARACLLELWFYVYSWFWIFPFKIIGKQRNTLYFLI